MKRKVTNLLSFAVIALFFVAAVASSSSDDSNSSSKSEESASSEDRPNWKYSEEEDVMTGEKRYFASSTSTNKIDFEFPYNGGSRFYLTVRNMGKSNEVILQVSKGQFMTSISGSQSCRVKFDDEQPLKFTYNSAADGSSEVIFFNNSKNFLTKLRTAKKVMIEAPFYSAGNQIIYFDVEGLEWNK